MNFCMNKRENPCCKQVTTQKLSRQSKKNWNILAAMLDTIKLCNRQNLPHMGHHDSVKERLICLGETIVAILF